MLKKKQLLLATALLFFTNNSFATKLPNDFRDDKYSTHLTAEINLKSDKLPLNTFKQDWLTLPEHNENNHAFTRIYAGIHFTFSNLKFGLFREKNTLMSMNTGAVHTWFIAENDWSKLLFKNTINSDLDITPITLKVDRYESDGVYLQKIVSFNKYNFLSLKAKLLSAKEMQKIDVSGYNSEDRFELSVDYYYSDKNHITKNALHDNIYKGLGYGFDLEYIFDYEDIYIYFGIFDIGSTIYWEGISYMHYDLDTQTIYLGDDGYNHYKPFGEGYYLQDVNYRQKIPIYYKASLSYKLNDYFLIGSNSDGYKDLIFNELYFATELYSSRYKVGYFTESKDISIGMDFSNFSIKVLNFYDLSNRVVYGSFHFYY